ncbi:MAG: ketoacyl-ACP synthase III [Candidatus Tectomicrobia bacterium]|uniref:Ketoacyl-ACP synthase III n=1 Tax=Tectimicrobiota bacterium TaxID=2528274 RepID=A0A937W3K9_UNCTE|nr:ketoacyl-ACP synthase III [Candidatus Tectomicrobia bacterium]
MSQVCIRGVGCYTPEARLTNQELTTRLGVTDDYIVKLTGVRERRRAAPEEATSDMAVLAAQAALHNAGIAPEAIDGVMVATATPDHVTPSTANMVQTRLGLRAVPSYDLNAGCTGSLYALITASSLIRAGVCQTMLVIGAEIVSRMVDLDDPETALVFGDGAGAMVVQSGPGQRGDLRLLSQLWGSDGSKSELIMVPAGGSRCPASSQTVEKHEHFLRMQGSSVFRFAVRTLPMLVHEVLTQAGRTLNDLALLIPHQANWRIIEAAARKLPLDLDKIVVNIDRYGNTSAASVLLALEEARRLERLRPGDTAVMASFGAGLTWAAVALEVVA